MKPRSERLAGLWIVLLGLVCGSGAAAAAPGPADVVAVGAPLKQLIGPELAVYLDDGGTLTLPELQRSPERFQQSGPARYFGLHKGRLWVRLTLVNTTQAAINRWLVVGNCLQESVDLYLPQADGSVSQLRNGTRVAVEDRSVPTREVLFPVALQPGQTQTLYLAISGRAVTAFSLGLWDSGYYLYQSQQEAALKYLATGTNVLLIAGCVLVAQARRRWTLSLGGVGYLLLCAYSMVRDGYGVGLFPADGRLWQQHVMQSLLAAACLCQILFAKVFLNVAERSRRLSAGLQWAAVMMGVLTVLAPFVFLPWVSMVSTLLVCVLLTGLTWRYATDAASWAYLAWWGLVWVGLLVTLSKRIGWLSMDTVHGLWPTLVGLLLATLTLSYGLYRSVMDIQKRSAFAQDQLIQQQRSEGVRLRLAVRRKTREQRAALLAAKQAGSDKSHFLSMMAHELRAPLHVILGHDQLLRRELQDKPVARLDVIERNARKLYQLIEHAFAYSRGTSEAVELEPVAVDLQQLLDHLPDEAQFGAGSSKHPFTLTVEGVLPARVIVDPQRLQQVLLNLLANAFKYGGAGPVQLRVQVLDQSGLHHLRFSVSDQGDGIPAEDQQRIFEPFTRLATSRHQPGQGLGLTIVRQLLKAMGSDIQVRSQPGQGCCFSFELHLAGGHSDKAADSQTLRAAMDLPPAALLQPLVHMVALGEVVELRRWIEGFKAIHPEWTDYLDALEKCRSGVDLAGLARLLALAGVQLPEATDLP